MEEEAGRSEKQEEVADVKPVEDQEAGPSTATPEKGCFDFDVFISFRGEDTRKGFTSHLHKELKNQGITTFIDSEDLEKGDEISVLFEHIERSKIFLPVFSINYADSKWCLREITKMVEIYKKEGKQRRPIIPIFYDVRHYKESLGTFKEHKQHKGLGETEINEWKEALTEAGKISGYDLSKDKRTEAEIITDIGNEVSCRLRKVPFDIQPIGRASCIKNLKQMLEKEKEGVRKIGICGMGGIGKTTLAMALYNEFFLTFEDCCFLSDIREKEKRDGLPSLQEKLMRSILKNGISIDNVKRGLSLMKHGLSSKKVLLVLDDVNDDAQLEALTANRGEKEECFGAGSKIIITTRDKDVLLQHGLQECDIYFLERLNDEDSLQLFRDHAFDKGQSFEGFDELSSEVVAVAQGLPLALKEFGSHFRPSEKKQKWEEELKKLKSEQLKKVRDRLKISYDGLEDYEKSVFLDIACFFIGMVKKYPVYMWEACKYYPDSTLEALENKSLIKINEKDEFEMHDQIRDMGRMIVEEKGDKDHRKYCRPWSEDLLLDVLRDAEVSLENHYVQGIDFTKLRNEKKKRSWEIKWRMPRLRMITGANDNHRFEEIPSNIRWLDWKCCPHQKLPFHNYLLRENLCVLDLSNGKFEDFGDIGLRSMEFPNLKVLNLSGCSRLISTPDFTYFTSLQKLVLDECCSLTKINESIRHLKELVELSMVGCKQVSVLPDSIGSLDLTGCFSLEKAFPNLKVLDLSGCSLLKRTPDFTHFPSLEKLVLDECCSLTKMDESIGRLENLVKLSMVGCKQISVLPTQIGDLSSLKYLGLSGTSISAVPDFIESLQSLEILDLPDCFSSERVRDSICGLKRLPDLSLWHCELLERLPNSMAMRASEIDYDKIFKKRRIEEKSLIYGKLRYNDL